MKTVSLSLALGLGLVACGGSTALSKDAAQQQVSQLITLYKENRTKFVSQKQEIEQAKDCGRATSLKAAIDDIAKQAAMSPEKTDDITAVQMELTQAETTCKSK
jgi:hypothetical protein